MKEETYIAADGAEIKYIKIGEGEPLLCMHGSGRNKELWMENGWVHELKKYYTVVAMDIRGFGHSTVYHDENFYDIDRILGDIQGVMQACGAKSYRYLGHSYGATIGFQALKAGLPITKAVFASGSMSSYFFTEICPKEREEYRQLAEIKRKQAFAQLKDYTEEDIEFIKQADMDKFYALFSAWSKWKPVPIEKLENKVSIYTGTLDFNDEMVEITTNRQDEFRKHGVVTKCFEGLHHEELVSRADVCMPWVLEHLQ